MMSGERYSDMLSTVYTKKVKLMCHIAYTILHDRHKAEDAVQNAFVRLASHLLENPMDNEDHVCALSVVIVKQTAIDMLREDARRKTDPSEDDVLTKIEFSVSGDDMPLVMELVRDMPDEHKTVLQLSYFFGYPSATVAKLIGISDANVRKRLQRAKDWLTQRFKEAKSRA